MTIHFGKRNGGDMAATAGGDQSAANLGDTLYIPFQFFNDSGASIFDTGLEFTDIEIFKNNFGTTRATDSGVFLGDTGLGLIVGGTRPTSGGQADTGNYTPFQGLYRCGIRIQNNTADTGFFDAGSMYHVALTGQSLKTGQAMVEVNFFIATFEIEGKNASAGRASVGDPKVDVISAIGDTGAINTGPNGHLSTDSGTLATVLDTGKVSVAVWNSLSAAHQVAATYGRDVADSGKVAAVLDTGKAAAAVWVNHVIAEPAQGLPAATASLGDKLSFLYKAWRNRHTVTATTYSLFADDATTVDQKATVSDDATTFDRTEIETGP